MPEESKEMEMEKGGKDKNSIRQSAEYMAKIQQIADGEAVAVQPRYAIIVCPQTSYMDILESRGYDSKHFTGAAADLISNQYHVIYILDYHKVNSSTGELTIPHNESVCRMSYFMETEHALTGATKKNAKALDATHTNPIYDILDDFNPLELDAERNNIYGILKRDGGTEHAPISQLVTLINNINDTHMLSGSGLFFPPEFVICGFFTEDMITEVALELRSKFPNSKISLDGCVTVKTLLTSWDSLTNDEATGALVKQIDTNAVVSIDDVNEDILTALK